MLSLLLALACLGHMRVDHSAMLQSATHMTIQRTALPRPDCSYVYFDIPRELTDAATFERVELDGGVVVYEGPTAEWIHTVQTKYTPRLFWIIPAPWLMPVFQRPDECTYERASGDINVPSCFSELEQFCQWRVQLELFSTDDDNFNFRTTGTPGFDTWARHQRKAMDYRLEQLNAEIKAIDKRLLSLLRQVRDAETAASMAAVWVTSNGSFIDWYVASSMAQVAAGAFRIGIERTTTELQTARTAAIEAQRVIRAEKTAQMYAFLKTDPQAQAWRAEWAARCKGFPPHGLQPRDIVEV